MPKSRKRKIPPRPRKVEDVEAPANQLVSDVHLEIFHYTDISGIKGILETGQIWVTHSKYTNDKSEVEYSKDFLYRSVLKNANALRDFISERNPSFKGIDGNEKDAIIKNEIRTFVDTLYHVTIGTTPPYIACFSSPKDQIERDNGSLSMWRGYSKNTNCGYALVLDTKGIEALLKEEIKKYKYYILHLQDVEYKTTDEFDISDDLSSRLVEAYKGILNKMKVIAGGPYIEPEEIFTELTVFMTKFKHPSFRDENEVRLVASPQTRYASPSLEINGRPVFFRESQGRLVPTAKIFDRKVGPLPVKGVVVGPNENPDLFRTSLEIFFREGGMDIPITQSEIPFRMI